MKILQIKDIQKFLDNNIWWDYRDWSLIKQFRFHNFLWSIDFVNDIAKLCEFHKHHAEIIIRYNVVIISTTTHDADDNITDKDIDLIKDIDSLEDNK